MRFGAEAAHVAGPHEVVAGLRALGIKADSVTILLLKAKAQRGLGSADAEALKVHRLIDALLEAGASGATVRVEP